MRPSARVNARYAVATALAWFMAPSTAGAAEDAATERAAPRGAFVDLDGRAKDPDAVYLRHLESSTPGHLLTIGEELLFLGAGTTWYWVDREHNLADWDYPTWKQRLTLEAWRFDNNAFPMNFLAHPLNGAAFYAMPRANGHDVGVSAAYAFATSFAWEFLIEFREKVSINDLIVTQAAGMAIGEFSAKLWHYLNGLPPNPTRAQHALAATVGLPVWVKRRAYGEPVHASGPYDDLGLSAAFSRRLGLGYQARRHDWGVGSTTVHGVWLGGRLSSIPGEGRPGSFEFFFHQADVASLSLFGGFGERARELDLYSDVHLLGLYTQSLDARGNGAAATFAASMAYRYRFRDFTSYNDRLGIVHLPGPGVDLGYRAGPLAITISSRSSADFAGIHSAAFGDWAEATLGVGDRAKSILRKHNYHYAWGVSSRFGATLELPPLDASISALIGAYDSQEGADRTQEALTHDPDATDRVLELEAGAGFTIPSTPVRLGATWAVSERQSQVESFVAESTLHTVGLSLGLVL